MNAPFFTQIMLSGIHTNRIPRAKIQVLDAPMPEKIPLQYPVVLVHGIIAHDRASNIKFWGRIPDVLTSRGIPVFRGNTDAWGSYESNARILKKTIINILSQTKAKKVNIIAHSKGGIDSRYLVWKHGIGDKIASLTTICTPHHGSEVADLLYHKKILHQPVTKNALSLLGKVYGDAHPNLYKLINQLTTAKMKKFNERITMDAQVYYQSLYTTMDKDSGEKILLYTHAYIKEISGENDGLVSVCSAQWGDNIAKIADGVSHAEILDYKSKEISGVNIPDIYLGIVKGLSKRHF